MNLWLQYIWDAVIIAALIYGIKNFRTPPQALTSNRMAAVALAAAFILVLAGSRLLMPELVVMALAIGAVGMITGAVTFSGSLVAAGKLSGYLKSSFSAFPRHNQLLSASAVLACLFGLWTGFASSGTIVVASLILLVFALLLGVLFSVRVGGADMPVLICFLNATTGLAAAFCGIVVESHLLIACGALVAASGYILTYKMCRAMNRNLKNVLMGYGTRESIFTQPIPLEAKPDRDPMEEALIALESAKNVVIIPGYGMALAGAQFNLAKLSSLLEKKEKTVKFAIHPVAGRMPGHMNVLLAEADIGYDKIYEMETINPEFSSTDVALIAGACDVVNPSAVQKESTPISGMPILNAHKARRIIVCNLDTRPGYSGVENTLYEQENVILLLGDAKETIEKLIKAFESSH